MKKLLLIALLWCSTVAQAQRFGLSPDPRSNVFMLYWNDTLEVQSAQIPRGLKLTGKDIDCVNGWYFQLNKHDYWLYISQYGIMFTVKAVGDVRVNEHLMYFLKVLHDHFDNKVSWMTLGSHHG